MVTTAIHLSTSDSFQQHVQFDYSQLIINAFIESCKALDASIFESFLEEDDVFEDKNKYLFLASLKSLFDSYKSRQHLVAEVYLNEGTCQGCEYGKPVKLFFVVLSGRVIFKDQFAYIIEEQDGVLKDIYRCNMFCKNK